MRRRISAHEAQVLQMDEYIANAKAARKKSAPAVRTTAWEKANREIREMVKSRQFEHVKGVHFVAFYSILHREIYGFDPAELTPQERIKACAAANRLLEKTFNNDVRAMIEFMVWTWKREAKGEEYRRSRGEMNGWRVVWQTQFAVWTNGIRLVSDFIAAAQRAQASVHRVATVTG